MGAKNRIVPFSDVMGHKSPFVHNDWTTYHIDEFTERFFDQAIQVDNGFNIYSGGPTVSPTDEYEIGVTSDGVHKIIKAFAYSYTDKNHNQKYDEGVDDYVGKYLSLKLYVSDDGAWLLETAKMLENNVGDNTIAIFLETGDEDTISDRVVICVGGATAAKYFNDDAMVKYYRTYTNLSKNDVTKLVKNCNNKNAFAEALRGMISGLGSIVSWVPSKVGALLCYIGEGIESLQISEKTWDSDLVTPVLKFLDKCEQDVLAGIDLLSNLQTIELPLIGKVKLPPGFIKALKDTGDTLRTVMEPIKAMTALAVKAGEFVFALVCGIINGILDMLGGLFSFIGLILKAIGGGIDGVAEGLANIDYYTALLLEYTDSALQSLKKINWAQVVETIKSWLDKILKEVDLSKMLSNLNISNRTVGYYIGYIGINVLACFIGVGEIAAFMKLQKLEAPLAKILSVIGDVVDRIPAGAKVTVDALFGVMRSYVSIIIAGTKSIIGFINKIFEAVFKFIISLTRELFYLMIGGRRLALSALPPALLLQLLADLATIFVRRNLDRLGIQILETEGLYVIRYGEHVMQVTDKNGMRRYINEKLDMEEAAAKKRLDEEVELLAQLDKRIAYMEKHWIDHTGDGRKYGRHELETLADREVRYETEFRPSEKGEAGDAIAKSGKWEGKSFDAWGTPKDAFTRNSWQHKYQRSVNDLLTSIDDHFSKIANPKPGVSSLDKLIIDFKNFDEFNPELRKLVMKRIEDKHNTYLSTDFLDIIN